MAAKDAYFDTVVAERVICKLLIGSTIHIPCEDDDENKTSNLMEILQQMQQRIFSLEQQLQTKNDTSPKEGSDQVHHHKKKGFAK